MRRAS
ncbi:hypothetical protein E2C01_080464 [Portunus trituberculatus]|jgi:hypothetical protein